MAADDDVDASGLPSNLTYRLTLKGEGLSVDRAISEAEALGVISLLMGRTSTGVTGTHNSRSAVPTPAPQISEGQVEMTVGEYIEEVEAQTNADKIVAIASYLKRYRAQMNFSREQVKVQFQAAGETPPSNFARDFSVAVANKWIATSHDVADEFFVTKKGLGAVEQRFPRDVRRPRARAQRSPRKGSAVTNEE